MVIQCTECQTRFRLADEKIKPQGTKVRCSKCHHIFTVTPPAPAAAPEPAPAPTTPPISEETDFGIPGEQSPETAEAPDTTSFGAFANATDQESGDDFFSESEIDPGAFSFEEQLSSDSNLDWTEEEGGEFPDDFSFDGANEDTAESFDFSAISFEDQEKKKGAPLLKEQADEDFVAPVSPPPTATAPRAARDAVPLPKRKSPMRGVSILLGVLLLALAGLAGYLYWQGGKIDYGRLIERLTGQAPPAAVSGHIALGGLNGAFATNREAGQVFVIRGQATNDYPEARSAISVKGILYNKQGKILLQQTVFCGNPLPAGDIDDLPYVKIEETMNNQFGDSLSNLNVAPHKVIPFTIVFKTRPADVAECTVEVVDAQPGAKQ